MGQTGQGVGGALTATVAQATFVVQSVLYAATAYQGTAILSVLLSDDPQACTDLAGSQNANAFIVNVASGSATLTGTYPVVDTTGGNPNQLPAAFAEINYVGSDGTNTALSTGTVEVDHAPVTVSDVAGVTFSVNDARATLIGSITATYCANLAALIAGQ